MTGYCQFVQVVYVTLDIGIHDLGLRTDGVTNGVTKFSRIHRFPISVAKGLLRARSVAVLVDLKGDLID